jgi:hypothetical protein
MFRGRHHIKHCRYLDCRVTDGTRRSLVPLEVLDFLLAPPARFGVRQVSRHGDRHLPPSLGQPRAMPTSTSTTRDGVVRPAIATGAASGVSRKIKVEQFGAGRDRQIAIVQCTSMLRSIHSARARA